MYQALWIAGSSKDRDALGGMGWLGRWVGAGQGCAGGGWGEEGKGRWKSFGRDGMLADKIYSFLKLRWRWEGGDAIDLVG